MEVDRGGDAPTQPFDGQLLPWICGPPPKNHPIIQYPFSLLISSDLNRAKIMQMGPLHAVVQCFKWSLVTLTWIASVGR